MLVVRKQIKGFLYILTVRKHFPKLLSQAQAPGMESEFNPGALTPGYTLEGSGELLQNTEAQAPPSDILMITGLWCEQLSR